VDYIQEIRSLIGHRPLIVVGSNVIILNQRGQVLLQQRSGGTWGLPGGLLEIGETLEETAKREVFEETGLMIGHLDLVGVFSGPQYFFTLKNKDQIYAVTAVYVTSDVRGEPTADGVESKSVGYFDFDQLPEGIEKEYKDYIEAYLTTTLGGQ
jgi:ADP-ribose pyrophosphatase YjhB (NUDIX family)